MQTPIFFGANKQAFFKEQETVSAILKLLEGLWNVKKKIFQAEKLVNFVYLHKQTVVELNLSSRHWIAGIFEKPTSTTSVMINFSDTGQSEKFNF